MAGITQIAQIRVNRIDVSWTDDSKRKPRPCRGCGTPTTGRRDEIGGRSQTWCLQCTFTDAFQKGGL